MYQTFPQTFAYFIEIFRKTSRYIEIQGYFKTFKHFPLSQLFCGRIFVININIIDINVCVYIVLRTFSTSSTAEFDLNGSKSIVERKGNYKKGICDILRILGQLREAFETFQGCIQAILCPFCRKALELPLQYCNATTACYSYLLECVLIYPIGIISTFYCVIIQRVLYIVKKMKYKNRQTVCQLMC